MAQLVKQLVTHHVHTRVHHCSSSNNLHPLNSTQQRVSTSRREVFNIYISFCKRGNQGTRDGRTGYDFIASHPKIQEGKSGLPPHVQMLPVPSRKPEMGNRSQTPHHNPFCQRTAETLVLKLWE